MVREDFLQQNAFVDVDGFSSYDRQEKLLAMILRYDELCRAAIDKGAPTGQALCHSRPGEDRPRQERGGGGVSQGL